jgi:Peptidase M61 N-terminal domain
MLLRRAAVCALPFLLSAVTFAADQRHLSLRVDATDLGRKLIHAELDIPVEPGELTLAYPKWIPVTMRPPGR